MSAGVCVCLCSSTLIVSNHNVHGSIIISAEVCEITTVCDVNKKNLEEWTKKRDRLWPD